MVRIPARILYALTSGVLLGLAFALPFPAGLLAFVAMTPLLLALEYAPDRRSVFRVGLLSFGIYHGISHWFLLVPGLLGDSFLLLLALLYWLVHPLFCVLPLVAYSVLRRRLARDEALFLFPFLWTAYEWLRTKLDFWTPELALGYTQADNALLRQGADIAGVWGLSFIVVLLNVLLSQLLLRWRDEHRTYRSAWVSWIPRPYSRRRIIAFVLLLSGLAAYGWYRLAGNAMDAGKEQRELAVILVQPNIDPWSKWEQPPAEQLALHFDLLDSLLAVGAEADLAVWSETALTIYLLEDEFTDYRHQIRRWVDSSGIALLTGVPERRVLARRGSPVADTISHNALLLVPPEQPPSNWPIYRKIKLTPFAERVPLADVPGIASYVPRWQLGLSGWAPGTEAGVLRLPRGSDTTALGAVICLESMYPALAADAVREGAEALVVVSNDGWFDGTNGPARHVHYAMMRAVETRRAVIRCANTGVSAIIDPTGKLVRQSENAARLAFDGKIELSDELSLYVVFGDILPKACCVIVLLAFVWLGLRRREKGSLRSQKG